MIDKIVRWTVAYIEFGFDFLISHLMTFEGIIGLMIGVFFLGLLSRLRT